MKETQIHIRPAIPSEHGSLEDLQLRASLANPGDREAIQSAPDAVDLPLAQIIDNRVFVAEVNAAIAGFAVVLPNDDASAELDGLFVDPDMWRHGIGRALVDYCVDSARRQGVSVLHVTGNPHAGSFYLRCGFEPGDEVRMRLGAARRFRKIV
ncbi:GNAT family N-acetyltransferase [Variovorax boronicumulans]|uniref:GNAT family N-acetyltransferase n=1 Tax=Variovorax boronicumulans TaxID=436515 RepID=UPI0036F3E5F4